MLEYYCQDCGKRGFVEKKMNLCPNKKCEGVFIIYYPIEENKYEKQLEENQKDIDTNNNSTLTGEEIEDYLDYYFDNGNI